MYTYGWFMLKFDLKQQNSVKQLSFNKTKIKKNERIHLSTEKWLPLVYKKRVFAFWKWETVNFLILFPGVFQISDIFVNESAQHSEGYNQREESYREASVLPQGFAMKVPPAFFGGWLHPVFSRHCGFSVNLTTICLSDNVSLSDSF